MEKLLMEDNNPLQDLKNRINDKEVEEIIKRK